MIYPIVAYGDPVLKMKAKPLAPDTLDVKQLAADMFETMYEANGVGLAAPQVGKSVRLFVIDAEPMDEDNLKGFKHVFINPELVAEEGEAWDYEEGCLSIPSIRAPVSRASTIRLRYQDLDWKQHEQEFSGLAARVIQHEYDHLEGVLFTDRISPFKKQLLRGKLASIVKGDVKVDYRMRFGR
jgi:peptide deformylase